MSAKHEESMIPPDPCLARNWGIANRPNADKRVFESYTASGTQFRLAYCRRNEFHLSLAGDGTHSRFGTWEEICEDLAFLDEFGVLPRSSSARPW